jgi:two-component system, LytTR family, response regulator
MRAILADDEILSIGTLKKLLEMKCPQVTVVAECENADDTRQKIMALQPDVVFLDIAMPGKSGLGMLAEMQPVDFEVIFVTAFDEYTMQAIHYSAVDYLLKPVDEERLAEAVLKTEKRLQQKRLSDTVQTLVYNLTQAGSAANMKICIPTLKGFQVVSINDIVCCEADNSYTNFFLADGSRICSAKTLLDYEILLQESSFIRVHKSYLINLQHIKEYRRGDGGTVTMNNGMEIEVSRRKKEAFLEQVKKIFKY